MTSGAEPLDADTPPVFDPERLAELRAVMPSATLHELVHELLDAPPGSLQTLLSLLMALDGEAAHQPQPMAAAAAAAHKLKGSAMMLGLRQLQDTAARIEATLRSSNAPTGATVQAWQETLSRQAQQARQAMLNA